MPEEKSGFTLTTPVAILIAGVLIAGGLYLGLAGDSTPGPGKAPSVNIKDVKIADNPFIGSPDAKVVMAYWSDFQCPFCKAVEVGGVPQIPIEPAMPELIKEYVDTGKLKIVFKDFQFLGPDSTTAGLYQRAVWELYPDKFFAWREAMFKAQDEEHAGFGTEDSILTLTRTIPGLDTARLKALVEEKKDSYMQAMDADREEAGKFGISGTPAFITGKKLIPGADQLPAFKAAIDEQL